MACYSMSYIAYFNVDLRKHTPNLNAKLEQSHWPDKLKNSHTCRHNLGYKKRTGYAKKVNIKMIRNHVFVVVN